MKKLITQPFTALLSLIAGTILLSLMLIAATALHIWSFGQKSSTVPTDTIFVMGTAQYNGVPSEWFAARLDHAADLYNQGIAPRIVTVGGKQEGDVYTEAQAGKSYLEKLGVPQNAITTLNNGSDTYESAEAFQKAAQKFGWQTTTVVTDASHSLRSVEMLKALGLTAHSSPTRLGPSIATQGAQWQSIIHETGGILQFKIGGKAMNTFEDMSQHLSQEQDTVSEG